jgi:hypothetical protein
MAIELAVFSSPLPVVAAGDVVQAVSGLSPDAAVDWAAAVPTLTLLRKSLPRRGSFWSPMVQKQLARRKTF